MNYEESQKRLKDIETMPARTVDELIAKLEACVYCEKHEACDTEAEHGIADQALLEFINDERVTRAFNALGKWYS